MVAPTEAELLARAADLVPVLKERADCTEELRRVPDETVSDVLATGLHRIGVPRKFGGMEVNYGLALDVAAELGRGCPSTSWCYGLWAAHAWLVGYWPLRAQQEVFGENPDTLLSSSLNPGKSTCEPVKGGYRLTGRWEFSSGCDHAGWVMLGAPNIGERNWVLVPRSDFKIVDTWYVSGLRGSGSKDIVTEDAFIPYHRILDVNTAGNGDWTGWELHGQSRYRVPIGTLLGWDLVGPMIGIAQGMIDEFTARLEGTSGPGTNRRLARRPHPPGSGQRRDRRRPDGDAAGHPRDPVKGQGGRVLHPAGAGEVPARQGLHRPALSAGRQPAVRHQRRPRHL